MISPSLGADLAEPIADIYREAELRILARLAAALATGMDEPRWELETLVRIQRVRDEALAILEASNPEVAAAIRSALAGAYSAGILSVYEDVGERLPHLAPDVDVRALAVASLTSETVRGVASAQAPILRAVDDVYRSVVARVVTQVGLGVSTRQEAVQRALQKFAGQGLRTITTRRGTMNLADYTEMAVRTATSRMALDAHLQTQERAGLDLVVIHPGPRACDICDRWARAILSRSGRTGTLRMESLASGNWVAVNVAASLDDARAAGWGHPNCRCALRAYLPGVTKADAIQRPRWDQAGYEAQQRQRAIELQIRGWKRRQAIAVTPDAAAESRAKVKAWQGAMREHLAANPGLKRQSAREQIG